MDLKPAILTNGNTFDTLSNNLAMTASLLIEQKVSMSSSSTPSKNLIYN